MDLEYTLLGYIGGTYRRVEKLDVIYTLAATLDIDRNVRVFETCG